MPSLFSLDCREPISRLSHNWREKLTVTTKESPDSSKQLFFVNLPNWIFSQKFSCIARSDCIKIAILQKVSFVSFLFACFDHYFLRSLVSYISEILCNKSSHICKTGNSARDRRFLSFANGRNFVERSISDIRHSDRFNLTRSVSLEFLLRFQGTIFLLFKL